MTETEKKALALVNEVRDERGFRLNVEMQREDMAQEALCRAIEQHEAFRQEVSDAVETVLRWGDKKIQREQLSQFIIPKLDPLVEAMRDACGAQGIATKHTPGELTKHFRTALAARGLEVRKIEEGE